MKFKVGDRVAVYNNDFPSTPYRKVGVIKNLSGDTVYVDGDGWAWNVHYKQCRRLVKRNPEYYSVWKNDLRKFDEKLSRNEFVKVKVVK